MRMRKRELGTSNLVGARVEHIRKQRGMKQKELLAQLQVNGVDMNASGLSKLEGQIRFVTDIELLTLSNVLDVPLSTLLCGDQERSDSEVSSTVGAEKN